MKINTSTFYRLNAEMVCHSEEDLQSLKGEEIRSHHIFRPCHSLFFDLFPHLEDEHCYMPEGTMYQKRRKNISQQDVNNKK